MDADVIVVGARCAGAPLATWLVRGGARVLLLDATALPRDQSQSTHMMAPLGGEMLDELGVGEAVRATTTPIRRFCMRLDGRGTTLDFGERSCLCPRRLDLDRILLDEARRAGAEPLLATRVTDLVRDGERVIGVRASRGGRERELRAPLVVGADGRRSTIARLVGAKEYDVVEGPRAAYWGYWPRPASYDRDPATSGTAFMLHEGELIGMCAPTRTDQLMVGVTVPVPWLESWRGDLRGGFRRALMEHSFTRAMVGELEPPATVYGTRSERYFFRQAAGPGWALVGDAGLHKDPTPGLGIIDALRDARALSRAILAGTDAALERYWHERDLASVDLFHFALDLGEPGYNNALNQAIMAGVGADPELNERFRSVMDRSISPFDAIPPSRVLSALVGQVVRGKVGVLGAAFKAGKRMGQAKKARRRAEQALLRLPAPDQREETTSTAAAS